MYYSISCRQCSVFLKRHIQYLNTFIIICEVIFWVSGWYFCNAHDQKDMLSATECLLFTGKTLRGLESSLLVGGLESLPHGLSEL